MVKSCSALNCLERWERNIKKKFHRIPQKDLELRTKWLNALRRINYDPKDAFICEKHFTASDYEINVHGNKNLKKGAVPSVFEFTGRPSKRTSKQIKPQRLASVQDAVKKSQLSGDETKNGKEAFLNDDEIEANLSSPISAENQQQSDEERPITNDSVKHASAGFLNKSTEEDPSPLKSEAVYIKSEIMNQLALVHFQPDELETNKRLQIRKETADNFENLKTKHLDQPEMQHQCAVFDSTETKDYSTSENEESKIKCETPLKQSRMRLDPNKMDNVSSISALNDSTEDHPSTANSDEHQTISYKNRRDPIYFGDFENADLDCPVKRSRFWRVAHEIVLKQKQRIKYYQCKERRQNDQILKLKRLLKEATRTECEKAK
ncbi:uncharacterized protein LOC109537059 isoform X2 [Dendroctonus ponderosae]|uniref:THAP-type domain-containing protein n=1 Tax=Dendroctonus ponderosae TaxID=77166 RepID=A0AAR5PDK5_DENPD|nr:uncharacterized protein LOC109537059 isoform X2 [Dendroctonus ponderosae]